MNVYRDEALEDQISAALPSPAAYPWFGCAGECREGYKGATWPIFLNDDKEGAYYSHRNYRSVKDEI
jgi:hypothetical protein